MVENNPTARARIKIKCDTEVDGLMTNHRSTFEHFKLCGMDDKICVIQSRCVCGTEIMQREWKRDEEEDAICIKRLEPFDPEFYPLE